MNRDIEKSLLDLDFASLTRRPFTPSPAAWEDQVLYFLMLDRFSDGRESGGYRDVTGRPVTTGTTPLYRPQNASRVDYDTWLRAGGGWQGGTIKGLTSKLGYLRRLGVTALWISPPFRQVAFEPSYHGYGVQNFLDIDPHFGTREEFRDFVRAAHEQGIYVILDVIAHHTGNVFAYNPDRYPAHDSGGRYFNDPRWDGRPYAVAGFNDRQGHPTLPFGSNGELATTDAARLDASWPDGAIWPREFQHGELFLRKGRIDNWGHYPEYAEGDMANGLKTLDVRVRWVGQYRQPSPAMAGLCLAYCFWIAYADLDGFRIDAAKHMDPDALRSFCDWIREFAQSIGKERFLLAGEVPGRELAWEVVERTGLDAALGIDDIPGRLERMVTGDADPIDYFSLFRNWRLDEPDGGKHRWYRDQVITLVDDHDQVRKWTSKCRFCGDSRYRELAFNVLAAQLTTAGIPCIYYGSEQGFDSGGRTSDCDVVLRENMFGGRFGGLCTQGRHFFNEQGDLYRAIASLTELRRQLITLRRGSQVLHRVSGDGVTFGHPRRIGGERMRSLVCWSRLFLDQETLVVFNTDESNSVAVWSTVAPMLRVDGDQFRLIFSYAPKATEPPATTLTVEQRAGLPAVRIQLPPAGLAIYHASPALSRLGPNPPEDLKPWTERGWHGGFPERG
jgi:glycosidase